MRIRSSALPKRASDDEVNRAYSQIILKHPRGLLNQETREAYEAWSVIKNNESNPPQVPTRGSSDLSSGYSGMSLAESLANALRAHIERKEWQKLHPPTPIIIHDDTTDDSPLQDADTSKKTDEPEARSRLRIRKLVSQHIRKSSNPVLESLRRVVSLSPRRVELKRPDQPSWVHTLTRFEYEVLDTSNHQVRFLRIPEATTGEVARFNLVHERHEGSAYLALSYVWGHQKPNVPIIINGKRFMIRPNLADFLWYAQNHLVGNLIWIDAISIDQKNDAEKGHQVRYMREIYSGARHVVSWISQPDREQVDEAVRKDTVKMIAEAAFVSRSSLDLCDKQDLIGNALNQLLTNAYWTRIWIVQEIWLAKRVQFLWQGTEVQWSCLQRLVEAARCILSKEPRNSWYSNNFVTAEQYRKDVRGRVEEMDLPWGLAEASWQIVFEKHLKFESLSPIASILEGPRSTFDRAFQRRSDRPVSFDIKRRYPMSDLIYDYSSHEATDPRDKIYALLGLAKNGENLEIDYSEQANGLAHRVARFINPEKDSEVFSTVLSDIMGYLGPTSHVLSRVSTGYSDW